MTRREFIENVNTWDALMDFAGENECYDEVSVVFDAEALDNYIDRELPDYIREYTWRDVYRTLSYVPTRLRPGEYVREASWLEFEEVTDEDFDEIKNAILNTMEGYWDEDEEEEYDYDEDSSEDDDEFVADEPFSITELFSACNSGLKMINIKTVAAITDENEAFNRLVSVSK